MKAIVQRAYGEPEDVLELRDVPDPVAQAGEVVVRVRAASVHADVWHVVKGQPYALRLMGAGLRPRAHAIPGTDVAGVVEGVGPGAARFAPGDAVFGEVVRGHQWRHGGAFAERVAAPQAALARMPSTLTFAEAAAVPTSGLIALRCLRDEGGLQAGQHVLINGAAGGVGLVAVQIAKALGARVTGVDLAPKLDVVRAAGADETVDGGREDFTRRAEKYDVILDVATNRTFAECRRILAPGGRYVFVGHDHYGARKAPWLGGIPRGVGLMVRSLFSAEVPRPAAPPAAGAMMETLRGLAEAGRLKPIVDRTFPLAEVPAAVRYLAAGQARGRVVIEVGET